MRIFVLEPKRISYSWWDLEPAQIRELPSGETSELPTDIQKMANSEMPLLGRRFRKWVNREFALWVNREFALQDEPIWVVWEGRSIKLD